MFPCLLIQEFKEEDNDAQSADAVLLPDACLLSLLAGLSPLFCPIEAGVSHLLVSLGHTGRRRVILDHKLNT